jgi:hypothetical protein
VVRIPPESFRPTHVMDLWSRQAEHACEHSAGAMHASLEPESLFPEVPAEILLAAEGWQVAQPFSGCGYTLPGGRVQEHARLIAILGNALPLQI